MLLAGAAVHLEFGAALRELAEEVPNGMAVDFESV